LKWKYIDAEGVTALTAALAQNTSLTELHFYSSEMGDEGAQALGAALAQNSSLVMLGLGKNSIGDAGAKALGAALAQNTSLATMNLSSNQIGVEGAKALGAGLAQNFSLTLLDLGRNQIGDAGAKALGAGLAKSSSLSTMNLYYNHIGDEGAKALGAGLAQNTSLTSLDLGDNDIGDAGAKALGLSQLSTMNLSSNQIGDEGAKALGAVLAQNTSLTSLDLHCNQIGDAGAKALGAGLSQNSSLSTMNLYYNQIGDEGAKALIDSFEPIESSSSLCSSKSSSTFSSSVTNTATLSFSVLVKVMNGDFLSVDCHLQESVQSIKRKLCEINPAYCVYRLLLLFEDRHQRSHQLGLSASSSVSIKAEQSSLVLADDTVLDPATDGLHSFMTLSDSHVLADYGIVAEDTLHLLLLPRKVCRRFWKNYDAWMAKVCGINSSLSCFKQNTFLQTLNISCNRFAVEYESLLERLCCRNKDHAQSNPSSRWLNA
jgi:hypothetical protein